MCIKLHQVRDPGRIVISCEEDSVVNLVTVEVLQRSVLVPHVSIP
jgi:hypothetical protein